MQNGRYTIIVEREHDVDIGAEWISEALSLSPKHVQRPLTWLQLGPPALEQGNLKVYQQLQRDRKVLHYGVEDFTPDMIRQAAAVIKLSSVQGNGE